MDLRVDSAAASVVAIVFSSSSDLPAATAASYCAFTALWALSASTKFISRISSERSPVTYIYAEPLIPE